MANQRVETLSVSVSPDLITKSNRFFDGTLSTIFRELIQNSRRAGATQVNVDYDDCRITYTDNGCGIENPNALLVLGDSSWDSENIVLSEDPAGMGFFSLARYGCDVSSHNWKMSMSPAQFTGAKPVEVCYDDSTCIEGLRVEFSWSNAEDDLAIPLGIQCRYCGMEVTLNGKTLDSADFLENALVIREYKGLRIALCRSLPGLEFNRRCVNFFGMLAEARLPRVAGVGMIAVDVTPENKHLRLELPSRRHVVEDDFFTDELVPECKRMLYAYIRDELGGVHSLPYGQWRQAQNLGIDLPEATPELYTMDRIAWFNTIPELAAGEFTCQKTAIDTKHPEMYALVSSVDFGEFAHTLHYMSTTPSPPFCLTLLHADSAYFGYSWYNVIKTLDSMVVADGSGQQIAYANSDCQSEAQNIPPGHVADSMTCTMRFSDGNTFEIPLNVLIFYDEDGDKFFAMDQDWCISEGYLQSCGSKIDGKLVETLQRAYFKYDSDCERSFDNEFGDFTDDLMRILRGIFLGNTAAAKAYITKEAFSRDMRRYMAQAGVVSVQVSSSPDKNAESDEVKVTLEFADGSTETYDKPLI